MIWLAFLTISDKQVKVTSKKAEMKLISDECVSRW